MNQDPSEICACLRHTTSMLYVVSCETKELARASIDVLDLRTGDHQSSSVELRRRLHSDLPGKRAIIKAASQILAEAMYRPGETPALHHHWTHREIVNTNLGPFDEAPHPPMPGQASLWE